MVGKLVVDATANQELYQWAWSSDKKKILDFKVKETGYYCTRIVNPQSSYLQIATDFVNPFGRLPAEFYWMKTVAFWLMVVYGGIAFVWIYLCWKHAEELLTLQVSFYSLSIG